MVLPALDYEWDVKLIRQNAVTGAPSSFGSETMKRLGQLSRHETQPTQATRQPSPLPALRVHEFVFQSLENFIRF